MKLIIGLGNPDREHCCTRHNFGWMIVDSLVEKKELTWKKHKASNSLIAEYKSGRKKVVLVKSLGYMNASGKSVKALKQYFKLPVNKIIVAHDDLDLPFGSHKLSKNRGAGGHKGIESIISNLKSKDFKRLRLGIGPQKGKAEDFVLKKFSADEKKKLPEIIDTAHLILETVLSKDFDTAATKYNQ